MLATAVSGFAISFGLIVAIGPQNAFVLRQGLRRRHVAVVASACFLSDGLLIALGVGGAGAVFALDPLLGSVMTWIGIAFITAYGGLALKAAIRPHALDPEASGAPPGAGRSARAALATALAFTWLNPHAYIDTLVLIGGVSSQVEPGLRPAFAGGAIAASALWFYGLGFGAGRFAGVFESPRAWRLLDVVIALVMWSIAGILARAQFA